MMGCNCGKSNTYVPNNNFSKKCNCGNKHNECSCEKDRIILGEDDLVWKGEPIFEFNIKKGDTFGCIIRKISDSFRSLEKEVIK